MSLDKSFLSCLSKPNKETHKKEKKDSNILDINNFNLNNSQDYYFMNKNKNILSINDQMNFNQNQYNIKNNNNNYNSKGSQNNSFIYNIINNNKFQNNFNSSLNNKSPNDDLNKLNNGIINQNCYQINIKNMNIHNSINNISQNYNINTSNSNNSDIMNENNKSKIHIEYKNEKNRDSNIKISNTNMELTDLLNNIEKISENQSGCRLLQSKLYQNPNKANDFYRVIEAKNILKKLTIDSFGNYLIQKILEYITDDVIQEYFSNIICPDFKEISLNPHGSRVIQKLLGRIYNNPNIMEVFNLYLKNNLLEIFLNQSSTHIIIKYISLIKYPNNQIIYSFIIEKILYISTHKHSCCTLQNCLKDGNNFQRKEILMSLAKISNQIFNDQYGNYAIQFALSLKDEEANKIIIQQYLNNFQKNISSKISSNVYEKVLEYCDYNTKQYIIKGLCNPETVKNLLYDTYGNYVLQKTLVVAHEPYKTQYFKYIAPLINGLKSMPNGLIIIHKIISHFPEIQNYVQINSNSNLNYNNNYYNINNNVGNSINNNIYNNCNNNINDNYNSMKNNDTNMFFSNKKNCNMNSQYNRAINHRTNNFYSQ